MYDTSKNLVQWVNGVCCATSWFVGVLPHLCSVCSHNYIQWLEGMRILLIPLENFWIFHLRIKTLERLISFRFGLLHINERCVHNGGAGERNDSSQRRWWCDSKVCAEDATDNTELPSRLRRLFGFLRLEPLFLLVHCCLSTIWSAGIKY